ncbi:unnamed protein product [Leptidea sinapis]|uniref:DUF7805 domain-containing protein n=1 Tax=Leptidea sinapis TaxID=189913 RepID=A0A5E4Q3E3_9NEOP|nr:unnamed protein product [Leptidea sinapis]
MSVLVAAMVMGAWVRSAAGGCGVAEYACRSGDCVRLDAYCDGEMQCLDGSDEPPHCTVCNRTYYGITGVAYGVAVRGTPRAPFLCHLTFTAGGSGHGDLVQLAFDEFRVGRYQTDALDACPDGYMQVSELGRPFTGGSWCGTAEGVALYYSETATVTVSVKLFRTRLGEPFGFRLRYKFLAQRDAIVRFGALEAPLERGSVSPGTYCTRTYEECHRKPCRLQSPNYPGMYPRQEHSHKMQIKRSISMAREARRCEFHVKASSSAEESNVTSSMSTRGRRGDLVWIYFSSFTHYSLVENRRVESGEREDELLPRPGELPQSGSMSLARLPGGPVSGGACAVELRIWDGGGSGALLGRYCDATPSLCARAALTNATRTPRPCSPPDGYVSAASLLSIAATSLPGTATHPLAFSLYYEFVDAKLEGVALPISETRVRTEPPECTRRLTIPGPFSSPRNALWFGRGGAKRLRCVYRIQADNAHIDLSLLAAAFGRDPHCVTRVDPVTGRPTCSSEATDGPVPRPSDLPPDFDNVDDEVPSHLPHLRIYETPWPGYRVPLACICDNSSTPLSLTSGGPALELELVAGSLSAVEDHRHIYFRGEWHAVGGPIDCAARRRMMPPGGHAHLYYPYRLLKAICPGGEEGRTVHVYTEEWWRRGASRGGGLLVVWAAREAGAARFSWMEVWRAAAAGQNHTGCGRDCLSLAACMPPALWCNGEVDCPGGADEAGACGAGARILAMLGAPAAAGAAGAVVAVAMVAFLAAVVLRKRRTRRDKHLLGALSAGRRFTEELLYDSRASSVASS